MKKNIANKFKGDIVVWTVIFALCVFSALAVYSGIAKQAVSVMKVNNVDTTEEYIFFFNQLFMISLGLVIMWIVHRIKWYNALQKSSLFLLIASIILVVFTILFGKEVNQASRQLFFFQTFDIAKVCLIIYLSTIFSNIEKYSKSFKQMALWVYLPVIVLCALIREENNSTAGLMFISVIVLMFVAHIRMKYIGAFIGIVIVGLVFIFALSSVNASKSNNDIEVVKDSKRVFTPIRRIKDFIAGERDPNSQEAIASLAIAKGGLIGVSPGKSEQRYRLANVDSDYIFAIIVEEYGFLLGAIPIVLLFVILMFRGVRIALNSKRTFSAYLVFGITFMYVTQGFINMLVSVDLFPVTGQPMPFVSKGGSAFMVCCVAFGLVLSESRINDEEKIAMEQKEIDVKE